MISSKRDKLLMQEAALVLTHVCKTGSNSYTKCTLCGNLWSNPVTPAHHPNCLIARLEEASK